MLIENILIENSFNISTTEMLEKQIKAERLSACIIWRSASRQALRKIFYIKGTYLGNSNPKSAVHCLFETWIANLPKDEQLEVYFNLDLFKDTK